MNRRKKRRRQRRKEIRASKAFLVSEFERLIAKAYDVTYPKTFYRDHVTGEEIQIADENGRFKPPFGGT